MTHDHHTINLAGLRPRLLAALKQLIEQEPFHNWKLSAAIRKLLDEALKARGL